MENIEKTEKYSNISYKILIFTCSILYGLFVLKVLENHIYYDTGDLNSYLYFFNNNNNYLDNSKVNFFNGDSIFRNIIFSLQRFFDVNFEVIFGYIAFICSVLVFYIFTLKAIFSRHFFYILPLFIMIFFTPRVFDLFASGLRSGIAFVILLFSTIYLKSIPKYILMALSVSVHLSMLPIIFLYFISYILYSKKINAHYITSYIVLLLMSFIVVIAAKEYHNSSGSNMGVYYSAIIIIITIVFTFTNRQVIKNTYGLISIGLLTIVLLGLVFDFDFRRYIGNALLFYLLFVINNFSKKTIWLVSLSFLPFFLLTNFYKFTNYV